MHRWGVRSFRDGYGFSAVERDSSAEITVWVDAAREPIAKAFQEADPAVGINIETYDGSAGGSASFKNKVAFCDQSGEGWPDVVFSTQQNDTALAGVEQNGVFVRIAMPLAAIVSVAPVLVLVIFLFSQRFFVSGMTAGGTKE